VIWSQINGKDWTLLSFLKSDQGGLGLDVAQDTDTKNAMQLALYCLLDEDIGLLKGKRLDKNYFNTLLTGGDRCGIFCSGWIRVMPSGQVEVKTNGSPLLRFANLSSHLVHQTTASWPVLKGWLTMKVLGKRYGNATVKLRIAIPISRYRSVNAPCP